MRADGASRSWQDLRPVWSAMGPDMALIVGEEVARLARECRGSPVHRNRTTASCDRRAEAGMASCWPIHGASQCGGGPGLLQPGHAAAVAGLDRLGAR